MEEFIMLGGLAFVAGLLVGKHIGDRNGISQLRYYMMSVSGVHNVMRHIHEKHGLTAEVNAELKAAGFEVVKVHPPGSSRLPGEKP